VGKNIFIAILGLAVGIFGGYCINKNYPQVFSVKSQNEISRILSPLGLEKRQVIGFLPYWLLDKADNDYLKYLTTITYFGLTIAPDGTIEKFTNPGEAEPGWYALDSGKADQFLTDAKKNDLKLSLLIFNGDEKTIAKLVSDPLPHARNLVEEVAPIMKQYGFADLNLDIESVKDASEEARLNFTAFVKEVKRRVDKENLGTVTLDTTSISLIKKHMNDVKALAKIVDYVVLMAYDFHYIGSYVTGPVAPLGGSGIDAEFDSEVAVMEALKIMPAGKLILGAPLYGYEWETLSASARSAVVPGSGITASNRRVEALIKSCTDCTIKTDKLAKESYLTYRDEETGTYHQIFYPDKKAMTEKVKFAKEYGVGGMALWALGYEGDDIIKPFGAYK